MNPDKLFDYLEGTLSPKERTALEEQLMSDEQLQREFAVARQIHAGMRGDSREVVLPAPPDVPEQGRKMAIRIGVAFMVLMFVNVGIGLWFIARHETKNPNRALLEAQAREQIRKSLQQAAATALTPSPSLGVSEITISAAQGRLDIVANEVVALAGKLGGSATKGLPDEHRIGVLVDIPSNRESEFRTAIGSVVREKPGSPIPATTGQETPGPTTPATAEKKSFVVQIVEAAAK
jgi:hypothetical protein